MEATGSWRAWLLAARPRTLPAALVPVALGTAAVAQEQAVVPLAAAICLLFTLLLQIGANFANDADDFAQGADTEARRGPTRAVASGLIPLRTMRVASWMTLGLAFAVGLLLIPYGGWKLLFVGIACVIGAIVYTGGPWPLGYRGWGEVMVMIYFGGVAVGGTAYVQAGHLGGVTPAMALLAGALATNLLVVNNHRDRETDLRAGKMTLAARFGRRFADWEYRTFVALGALAVGAAAWQVDSAWPLLGWLALPMGVRLCRRLALAATTAEYGSILAGTAAYLILNGGLTAIGLLLAARPAI